VEVEGDDLARRVIEDMQERGNGREVMVYRGWKMLGAGAAASEGVVYMAQCYV